MTKRKLLKFRLGNVLKLILLVVGFGGLTFLILPSLMSLSLYSSTSSLPSAPTMEQFQMKFHEHARYEQEEFCRRLQARSTAPNPEQLPLLVPSALRGIQSPFDGSVAYWMEIYPGHDIVSDNIRNSGQWESDNVLKIGRWLKDYQVQQDLSSMADVTFVDIGANVGWYTFAMAAMGVSVIAIEPFESNVELMRRSLCRNPHLADRITIYPIALSSSSSSSAAQNQTSCILLSGIENVGDTILECNKTDIQDGYALRAGQISSYRLDDVIGSTVPVHKHIGALKMDTEGHEGHVVAGGPIIFGSGRIPHIQSEYSATWIQAKGSSPKAMLETFARAGYQVRRAALDTFATWDEAFLWEDVTDLVFEKQQR